MGCQRVKVVNLNEGWMGTECCIDGREINNVRSVDFRVAVDEIPQFTFETIGMPDIDMGGVVRFQFTPETVQQASIVLRNELIANKDLRGTFLTSMISALDDDFWNSRETAGNQLDIGYDDFKEAAELMLNRLIGIEKEEKNT